jgi:hypothetical protein
LLKHLIVCLWEQLLSFGCKVVDRGRLAATTSHTALLDNPIPFKGGKVCPDSIVREIEGLGQFVHSTAGTAQQRDDLTACAC